MVFDITRRETLEHVADWINELGENACMATSRLLVGNKSDLEDNRLISYEEAAALARENDMDYVETSAKTGDNISEAFDRLTDMITKKVADGTIDASQECSGIRVGVDTKIKLLKPIPDEAYIDCKSRCLC